MAYRERASSPCHHRRSTNHHSTPVSFARAQIGTVTYHGLRICVRGGLGIPLGHDLTGRAGIGAVEAALAGNIRSHGPTAIHLVGRNGDETSIRGEWARSTTTLERALKGTGARRGSSAADRRVGMGMSTLHGQKSATSLVHLGVRVRVRVNVGQEEDEGSAHRLNIEEAHRDGDGDGYIVMLWLMP